METKNELIKTIERKGLSKKIRFEVFKRDMFKCQYCGKSPIKDQDVVLEVDHIVPVSEGGSNDMINLITSCWDCNRGKGARKLDDRQILVTQHEEIEKLQIENEQFDHLIEYKKELMNVEVKKLELLRLALDDKLSILNRSIDDNYLNTKMKKLVRKYGAPQMIEVIEEAYSNSIGKYDKITDEDGICNRFFSLIENHFNYKDIDPIKQKISYIFGISRNTFNYINQKQFYIITNELVNQYNIIFDNDEESLMKYLIELETLLKNGTIKNWTALKSFIGDTQEDIISNLKVKKNKEYLNLIQNVINQDRYNEDSIELIGNLYFKNELEFVFGKVAKFEYEDNCIKIYLQTSQIGVYSDIKDERVTITLNWNIERMQIEKNILDTEYSFEINILDEGKISQGISLIGAKL